MEPSICLEPAEELQFRDKFGHVAGVQLVIKNKEMKDVYFKVKSNAVKFYNVRPSVGMIKPHGQIKVIIQPRVDSADMLDTIEKEDHRFLVQCAFVSDYFEEVDDFWKRMDHSQMPHTRVKLRTKVVRIAQLTLSKDHPVAGAEKLLKSEEVKSEVTATKAATNEVTVKVAPKEVTTKVAANEVSTKAALNTNEVTTKAKAPLNEVTATNFEVTAKAAPKEVTVKAAPNANGVTAKIAPKEGTATPIVVQIKAVADGVLKADEPKKKVSAKVYVNKTMRTSKKSEVPEANEKTIIKKKVEGPNEGKEADGTKKSTNGTGTVKEQEGLQKSAKMNVETERIGIQQNVNDNNVNNGAQRQNDDFGGSPLEEPPTQIPIVTSPTNQSAPTPFPPPNWLPLSTNFYSMFMPPSQQICNQGVGEDINGSFGRYVATVLNKLGKKNSAMLKKEIGELISKFEQLDDNIC